MKARLGASLSPVASPFHIAGRSLDTSTVAPTTIEPALRVRTTSLPSSMRRRACAHTAAPSGFRVKASSNEYGLPPGK